MDYEILQVITHNQGPPDRNRNLVQIIFVEVKVSQIKISSISVIGR